MLTVILPGFSAKNKEWALETAKRLELGHEVRPMLWEHWDNADMPWDAKDKAREIIEVAMTDTINIVAKSIGTLVASYILEAVPSRVEKVIFCGIPINDLNENDKEAYRQVLNGFPPEQIICLQNEDDPHGTFEQVKDFLAKINTKIKVVSKDRNDHEYPYYSEFGNFLKNGS